MNKLILLFLIYFPLCANMPSSFISSDEAYFENGEMQLNGKVEFNHEMGHFTANKARYIDGKKNTSDDQLHLQGDVLLKFNRNKEKKPLFIESQFAHINFLTMSAKKESIKNFCFYEKVKIYDDEFSFTGSKVFYDGVSNQLYLYSHDKDLCYFSYNQDEIFALSAQIAVDNFSCIFDNSTGKILAPFNNKTSLFVFSAKAISYNPTSQIIKLEKDVFLQQQDLFTIQTDALTINRSNDNTIKNIHISGNTTLSFTIPKKTTLICQGDIDIDNENKEIIITPKENTSICFRDDNVTLNGDNVTITYLERNQNFFPKEIILSKNISFIIHSKENFEKCCGSADTLLYNAITKKLILTANNNKNILLWKKDGICNLSTKEIQIDIATNTFKGIGPLKIFVNEEEKKLIKNTFKNYSHEQKKNS